jgi:ComEC/Rec2-related protein
MVGLSISFAAGILAASWHIVPPVLWIVLAGMFLMLALVSIRRPLISSLALLLLVTSLAGARYSVSTERSAPASIEFLGGEVPRLDVEVIGRVAGRPEYYSAGRRNKGILAFQLRCEGVRDGESWKRRIGTLDVRMHVKGKDRLVFPGDRVYLRGRLDRKTFPGTAAMEMTVSDTSRCTVLSKAGAFTVQYPARLWNSIASRRLEQGVSEHPESVAVLKAMVLGERKKMPAEILDRFRRTGSYHIFAISGLHVGIVGLLLALVLKSFGVPKNQFGLWLLPLLGIYVVSTGMQPSALRALTMAGVFLLAPLFGRQADIPSSVAFSFILLLLVNPQQIHSAGFLFSFIVVMFIVMVFSRVPSQWLSVGGWRVYVRSLVITSLAAALASFPMTAMYFGTFAPIALICNLIVVPLTFCIVVAGWLSIVLPFASVIFNHSGVVFSRLLLLAVEWLDKVPGSSWQVSPPPITAVLLWYGALTVLFTHARTRTGRRQALFCAGFAVLLALLG